METSGGKILHGGKVRTDIKYIEPTIIVNPDLKSDLMQEEIFGPIMAVIPFKTLGQAIKIVKSMPKPLAVYFYGDNSDHAQ
jgi:aldehyde dehydrogenase (NAD+)